MKSAFRTAICIVLTVLGTNIGALELQPSTSIANAAPSSETVPDISAETIQREFQGTLWYFTTGRCLKGKMSLARLNSIAPNNQLPMNELHLAERKCGEQRLFIITHEIRLAYYTQDISTIKRLSEEAVQIATTEKVEVPEEIISLTRKTFVGYFQLLYIKIKNPAEPPLTA